MENSLKREFCQLDFSLKSEYCPDMPKLGRTATQLPDSEIEICKRFRQIRESLKWKQIDFAKALDIPTSRLKSYEYARAALPYSVGRKMGQKFDINQRWLAEGKLPQNFYVDISYDTEGGIPTRATFSEAYAKYIWDVVEDRIREFTQLFKIKPNEIDSADARLSNFAPAGIDLDQGVKYYLIRAIEIEYVALPNHLKLPFLDVIRKASSQFFQKHYTEIGKPRVKRKRKRLKG